MRRLRSWILGGALAVSAAAANPAAAADINVNVATDGIASDSSCTLREAVTAANTNAPFNGCAAGDADVTDTIDLRTIQGDISYGRTLLGDAEDGNATGDLDVLAGGGPIRFFGLGAAHTRISSAANGDRVLDVIGPAEVTFEEVAVTAGALAPSSPGNPARGGGIRAADGPALTFKNASVSGTTLSGTGAEVTGGGVYQAGGSLTADNANFSTNNVGWSANASDNGLIAGGAIYMEGGALTLDHTSFNNNNATGTAAISAPGIGVLSGGAIAKSGGSVAIHRSWFVNNKVSFGNTTQDAGQPRRGGGLWLTNGATATIDESEFTTSQAATTSSLVPVAGGAIAAENGQGDLTITNSTFLNNQTVAPAASTQPRQGGAIYWNDNSGANDALRIDNSTFSDNGTKTTPTTPSLSQGGALWLSDGTIAMAHDTSGATAGGTSTGNVAVDGRSLYYDAGDGSLSVRGSIFAEGAAPECGGPSKPSSAGYNVEQGPANDCLFSQPTDVIGDPLLGAMADNGSPIVGGPTGVDFGTSGVIQTRTIGPGPAASSVPREECLDTSGSPLTRDERGFPRSGAACNAGALESECAGKAVTVSGTAGNDVIVGSPGDDVIASGDGNDTISAGGGDDTICAGGGADTIDGEAGDDLILSGAGTVSPASDDTVDGGPDTDTISYADTTAVTLNLSDVAVGATPPHTSTGPGTDTVSNVENAVGSSAADTLTGDEGPNVLDGGSAGNTTIDGRGGDDTLIGAVGASGDTASYLSVPAAVAVDHPDNVVTGQGTDALSGIDNVTGSTLDDTFIPRSPTAGTYNGDAGVDSIDFSVFADGPGINLTAGAGNALGIENITGTPVNDVINGSAADNVLDGGDGVDQVTFSGVAAAVTASLADGTATGQGTDTLSGFENLAGSNQADTLTGDANDNVIDGRAQADSIDGGGGSDTAAYNGIGGAVTASLLTGSVTSANQGNDTLIDIENLRGSTAADTLIGDDDDNVIEGGNGADVVTGNLGNDTAAFTLSGSAMTVNLAAQTTAGGAGVDTMTGMESFLGSPSNDVITESSADNRIDGGAGVDSVTYAGAAGPISANLLTDVATGDGSDTLPNVENLTGSPGDDTLVSDGSDNLLDGGGGNDTASWAGATGAVEAKLTSATAGDGNGPNDIVGDDILANMENLTGGDGDDKLRGNSGDNVLTGGPGSDSVSYAGVATPISVVMPVDVVTGDGSDSIPSIENVTGTPQDDTFLEDAADNSLDGGSGRDVISFAGAAAAVDVDLGAGTAVGDGADSLAGFEDVTGSSRNDELTGDGGDNVLAGRDGDDDLTGGGGTDTADFSSSSDGVEANLGTGRATGQGDDTLASIENLLGTPQDDILGSSASDNVLDGGAGGADTADFSAAAAGVTADIAAGSAIGDGSDVLVGIEDLTGSPHDDILAGDPSDNTITGGDGSDTVSYEASSSPVTVDLGNGSATGSGSDSLVGDENAIGSDHDDLLMGDSGDNALSGGPGVDVADYSGSATPVSASLQTGSSAGAGNDSFAGIEDLTGSPGDDTLEGDAGNNDLDGGDGNDTVTYAHSLTPVMAALGTPGSSTGMGSDTLTAVENLAGSPGDDTLEGDDGDNELDGGPGEDTVRAGGGADILLLRDREQDLGDCGLDAAPDSVVADAAGLDAFDNCDGAGDTVEFPPQDQPPAPPGPAPPALPAAPPVKDCPKGKTLKAGKCKKKHKHKGKKRRKGKQGKR